MCDLSLVDIHLQDHLCTVTVYEFFIV